MPGHFEVSVRGGDLHVFRWGEGGPVVIAAHGITASGISLLPLGERLAGELTLIAPDLRGRGGSALLPGPFGMGTHAEDLAAVPPRDRAGALGHSMGAAAVTALAIRHPVGSPGSSSSTAALTCPSRPGPIPPR